MHLKKLDTEPTRWCVFIQNLKNTFALNTDFFMQIRLFAARVKEIVY